MTVTHQTFFKGQKKRDLNFTAVTSGLPVEEDLVSDGWTDIFLTQAAMLHARETLGLGKDMTPEELLQMADYRKVPSLPPIECQE